LALSAIFGALRTIAPQVAKAAPSIIGGLGNLFAPQSSPVKAAEAMSAQALTQTPAGGLTKTQGLNVGLAAAAAGLGSYGAYRAYKRYRSSRSSRRSRYF